MIDNYLLLGKKNVHFFILIVRLFYNAYTYAVQTSSHTHTHNKVFSVDRPSNFHFYFKRKNLEGVGCIFVRVIWR